MEILFNGDLRQIGANTTVARLLQELDVESRYVAVEVNYELVTRSQHKDRVLQSGDHVEVVTLVGGG